MSEVSYPEEGFACGICFKVLKTKSTRMLHERQHTGEKPFQCDFCRRRFTQRGGLTRHLRTHTGERPFPCDECDKSFAHKSNLTQHLRLHSGEKPFQCHHCRKTFTRKSILIQHERLHSGEKPFECYHCKEVFSRRGSLIHHIWQHNGNWPYKCKYCNKGFGDKNHLAIHERTHTGEKPFACTACGKHFSDKSNFSKHMRLHLMKHHLAKFPNEKFCYICQTGVSTKRALIYHIHKHAIENGLGVLPRKRDAMNLGDLHESPPLDISHGCKLSPPNKGSHNQSFQQTQSTDHESMDERIPLQKSHSVRDFEQESGRASLASKPVQGLGRALEVTDRNDIHHERPQGVCGSPYQVTITLDPKTRCLTKKQCDSILSSSGTVRVRTLSPSGDYSIDFATQETIREKEHTSLDKRPNDLLTEVDILPETPIATSNNVDSRTTPEPQSWFSLLTLKQENDVFIKEEAEYQETF